MANRKSATRATTTRTTKFHLCVPKVLPKHQRYAAALSAININPTNKPLLEQLTALLTTLGVVSSETREAEPESVHPQFIGALTTKYWGTKGVDLKVGFLERTKSDLANRILSHMNSWHDVAGANVQFKLVDNPTNADVRISLRRGGYWSYLGTDILQIPKNEQTMNLEGFSMSTPESEFVRVVRHETGHTLGFPHEHLRADLVARLNVQKTIAYFSRTQGWSADEVRAQVLTPITEASLWHPTPADINSIMCYQLPGEITVDGKPIPGGEDIDPADAKYAASIYPLVVNPPPPPPGGKTRTVLTIISDGPVLFEMDGKPLVAQ